MNKHINTLKYESQSINRSNLNEHINKEEANEMDMRDMDMSAS